MSCHLRGRPNLSVSGYLIRKAYEHPLTESAIERGELHSSCCDDEDDTDHVFAMNCVIPAWQLRQPHLHTARCAAGYDQIETKLHEEPRGIGTLHIQERTTTVSGLSFNAFTLHHAFPVYNLNVPVCSVRNKFTHCTVVNASHLITPSTLFPITSPHVYPRPHLLLQPHNTRTPIALRPSHLRGHICMPTTSITVVRCPMGNTASFCPLL